MSKRGGKGLKYFDDDDVDDGYDEYDEHDEDGLDWEDTHDAQERPPEPPASGPDQPLASSHAPRPHPHHVGPHPPHVLPHTPRDFDASLPWRCPLCTFDNLPVHLACDVCGSERPPPRAGPLPAPQSLGDKKPPSAGDDRRPSTGHNRPPLTGDAQFSAVDGRFASGDGQLSLSDGRSQLGDGMLEPPDATGWWPGAVQQLVPQPGGSDQVARGVPGAAGGVPGVAGGAPAGGTAAAWDATAAAALSVEGTDAGAARTGVLTRGGSHPAPFAFDTPSPDDLVQAARSKSTGPSGHGGSGMASSSLTRSRSPLSVLPSTPPSRGPTTPPPYPSWQGGVGRPPVEEPSGGGSPPGALLGAAVVLPGSKGGSTVGDTTPVGLLRPSPPLYIGPPSSDKTPKGTPATSPATRLQTGTPTPSPTTSLQKWGAAVPRSAPGSTSPSKSPLPSPASAGTVMPLAMTPDSKKGSRRSSLSREVTAGVAGLRVEEGGVGLRRGPRRRVVEYEPAEEEMNAVEGKLAKEQDGKELLHLIVVGHVDAGKSTLMGRMLHALGHVSQKEMHKNERESQAKGKRSFAYAWVLDEGSEERMRGITMSVAVAHFETETKRVVLLDAPGHRDFVPNMIAGASQADAAVLVVDASPGGFEAGMMGEGGDGGQTREHAMLVRSLGVEQLIVAVNKMDTIGYDAARFAAIRLELEPFLLRSCGFREPAVRWVPVSGSEGENLVGLPTNQTLCDWWSGPSLIGAVDALKTTARQTGRPLRLAIAEVLKTRTLGQAAVAGKLEGGVLHVGSKVVVMPGGEVAVVKAMERNGQAVGGARAGDSVDVGLSGVDAAVLMPGGVLCHPDYLTPVATRIEARILTLAITTPLLRGSQVVLHSHHAKEPARIVDLVALLDPKTGVVSRSKPRHLTKNQSALVQIVPERGMCLEAYSDIRALGRLALRAGGKTVAVGVVTDILQET